MFAIFFPCRVENGDVGCDVSDRVYALTTDDINHYRYAFTTDDIDHYRSV